MTKRRNKIITLCLCASLMISSTIWGSLAYLTDKTGPVTNVFTVGNVDIELKEYFSDEKYLDTDGDGEPNAGSGTTATESQGGIFENIVPGVSYQKKPVITVLADSADCYVRAKVTVDLHEGITNETDFMEAFYGYKDPKTGEIETKIYVEDNTNGSYNFGGKNYIKTDGKQYKENGGDYIEGLDGTYVRNVDNSAYVSIDGLTEDSFKSPSNIGFDAIFPDWASKFANSYILSDGVGTGFNSENWNVSTPTIDKDAKTITYYLTYKDNSTNNVVGSSTDDKPLEALFNYVKIPKLFDNAQAEFLENMEIKIEGHAIQSAGFEATTTPPKTAEQYAWEAFKGEYGE